MHAFKTYLVLLAIGSSVVVLLPACSSHICACVQQCEYFARDCVTVCSVNYGSHSAFQVAVDAAIAHYGATTKDSPINYQSFNQNNARVVQLQSQGYSCVCRANGW